MFVIKWCGHYVVELSARTPYTTNINEAKKWTTKKRAERYLSLKDKGWANDCTIIEVKD